MFVGIWNGIRLETMEAAEYNRDYRAGALKADVGYIISDRGNYVILDGKVVAQTLDNHRRVKTLKADAFDWKKITEYVEPKPKVKVVSERSTVEALAKEGEKKFEAVVAETPIAEATGEQLAKVVEEGQVAVAKVRKRRKPRTTTTVE